MRVFNLKLCYNRLSHILFERKLNHLLNRPWHQVINYWVNSSRLNRKTYGISRFSSNIIIEEKKKIWSNHSIKTVHPYLVLILNALNQTLKNVSHQSIILKTEIFARIPLNIPSFHIFFSFFFFSFAPQRNSSF